ncbi:MAG: autotransporter-associated beta strand repeat-containing protein [Thermoguttaceae bacterium]|jgi:titin
MLTSFPVTTTADNGAGSLRQAILSANGTAGLNTITFNIAGLGTHTIQPTSALPTITGTVIIDGTMQPGYAGSPLIQLDGSQAGGTFVDGLYITAGNSTVKGLDITGFTGTAIVLDTGGSNVIENNYLGIDPTGASADGNQGGGLAIYGSASNQIVQNVISANGFTSGSANGSAGVYVANAGANGNVFTGNFIGANKTGAAALGNGGVGIYIAGGAENTRIGTNGDGVNDTAERNIISGNSYQGIAIQGTSSGANTTGTIVAGDYIGTNAAGTAALPNGNNGVYIFGGAQDSRIGVNGADVDAAAERNLISGNAFQGVALSDSGTSSNIVAGNLIGTDVTGTVALPNSDGGIDVINGASSNRIGFDGTSSSAIAALERNVISGNGSTPGYAGIYVADAGTNLNVIAGNYIGVDSSGAIAMANSGVGVYVANGAENNRIGSDGNGVMDASKANVISGNAYEGVAIQGTSSGANTAGNIVAGNFIGTNAAGTAVLGNKSYGIWINSGAQSNRVGTNGTDTDAAGEGNLIAGNGYYMPGDIRSGVAISDAGTNSNLVAGNWIGTNQSGTASLPNANSGVDIFNGAENNQVGGSSALGNVIAFNTQGGVAVTDTATTGNSIRANRIYSNGGLGIDLGDSGVQVNHTGATSGPNNLQNYPLITAGTPGSTTVIQGLLNSLLSTTYTIDFYANSTPDITFYGPGQRYLGAISVTTDATGTANFSASLAASTSTGNWVTATATDPSGNTSEFAGDRQLPYSTPALSTATWRQLGPDAIAQSPEFTGPVMSGRIETAVPDPANPNIMYIAADGGGVWETTDWLSTSPTWTPLTDSQSSTVTGSGDYAFKSLAVYPGNPSIIYAAAAGPGGGILKSTNGGQSWTLLGNSVFDQVAFGSLVVDPNDSNTLYVTVLYGPNNNNINSGGVYKSTDGGVTWTDTTALVHSGWASDIEMDPNDPSTLFAGLTQDTVNPASNGLYESTNGGGTWTQLTGGLPTGSAVGDSIRVVVAPSSPQTVYATVFESADGLPHRFRSTSGGAAWTALPALPTDEEDRYWHIMLSVDPNNSQVIYVNGDHTVYVSTNGGSTWSTSPINDSEDPVGGYFDDSGDLVLTGDHGIYRVTNVGYTNYTFDNKQGNLSTSEFYTLTLDPTNADIVYGLAQDQFAPLKYTGYPVWNSTGQAPSGADSEGVGEIGKILVDPTSPNQLYQYAPNDADSFILSSTDGGATWTDAGSGIPTTLVGYGLGYASQKAFVMDPTNSQRLLVGTNQVYESTDGAASWTAISPVLSPSSNVSDQYITALAIAPSQPNTIYAATADGRMFVTQNNGRAWTEIDTGLPTDSYDQIVSIQVDPNNANRVFIVPGRFPTNVFGSAHVWMTKTGGAGGWTDITGNLPPEDWTNSIAVDWRPATPVLYIATARGVYQSDDLGVNWSRFGEALPNSPVTDLQLVPGLNVLAAATYGRGVWEIQLGAINRVWSGQGTTANWNDANNWTGDTAPLSGDNLIFASGAAQPTNTNNLAADTQFGNIVFGSGGYSVNGNAIQLNGFLDSSASTGNTTVNLGVTLAGASSVLMGGSGSDITFSQAINTNGFTLSVGGGAGQADFTADISGPGGVNIGGGTVTLSGTNTFTGGTTVSAGTLLINAASALPDGGSLIVAASGTFIFDPSQSAPGTSATGVASPAPDTAAAPGLSAPIAVATALANGPVTASVVSTSSPFLGRRVKNLFYVPTALSSVANDGVFTSHRSALDRTASSPDTPQSALPWAWLAAIEGCWNSSDQNKTTGSTVQALDEVLAQFGI